MFKKSAVLLKTMIRANSTFNILKHEKDKKKKRKMIGGIIGIACIYLMIIIYAGGVIPHFAVIREWLMRFLQVWA